MKIKDIPNPIGTKIWITLNPFSFLNIVQLKVVSSTPNWFQFLIKNIIIRILYVLLFLKRSLFFSLPLGLLGNSDHILQKICLKLGWGFIFGPYAHFSLMHFFQKIWNCFLIFLKIQRGDPLDKKKSNKNFQIFWKKLH